MITAGEVLKAKREKLKKDISTISEETKIQKRYLQYIEDNDFSKFDSEVFLVGFIKIYAKYLDLDPIKILALYRRGNPIKKDKASKQDKNSLLTGGNFTITPRVLITISIILFVLGILIYIGIQIYNFQSPPKLEILEPQNNITVTQNSLNIKGRTSLDVSIDINGEKIEETNGSFEHILALDEGTNIITIKAKKNSNSALETVEILTITYNKEVLSAVDKPIVNILVLEIVNASAWIKLDIDDENKISQVIQPSKQEFVVKNRFKVITGRITNTKVTYNGAAIELKTNKSTGVAEITCGIRNNALECN